MKVFSSRNLWPHIPSPARKKIQRNEQQSKGAANYLNARNSNKKNSYQLGHLQDTGGQVDMLNDLSDALRAMAAAIESSIPFSPCVHFRIRILPKLRLLIYDVVREKGYRK